MSLPKPTLTFLYLQYADLSEFGYGVAILSESKYGFGCQGNILRISLLRAATAPDAEQDQGSYKCIVQWLYPLTCLSFISARRT
jgi:alpha-mannosidase